MRDPVEIIFSEEDLSKIDFCEHSRKKYDQIYEDKLKFVCSYSWMSETDKYMIGTNSDEITRKILDSMYAKRAQAKSWVYYFGLAKILPILIPIFWMFIK